jgi:hypothetical protein
MLSARFWKETVVACFKGLYWHLPIEIEKIVKYRPRIERDAFLIGVSSVTATSTSRVKKETGGRKNQREATSHIVRVESVFVCQ